MMLASEEEMFNDKNVLFPHRLTVKCSDPRTAKLFVALPVKAA